MTLHRISKFLDNDETMKTAAAIRKMEAAHNPGPLEAAQICFPPPTRLCIAVTLHAVVWSTFFFFINPVLGFLFILLTYTISFGYTWPRTVRRIIYASFSRK